MQFVGKLPSTWYTLIGENFDPDEETIVKEADSMKYKIEFNYRYGKDYVYCNEYREDEQFVQPLNSNGKPLCTIAKTNIIAIKEYK